MKLSTKRRVQALLDRGMRWDSGPLRFFSLPSSQDGPKLGLLTSRKAYPRAVDRNRLKRLLRQAWRNIKVQGKREILVFIKRGIDIKNANQEKMNGWLGFGLEKKGLTTSPKKMNDELPIANAK